MGYYLLILVSYYFIIIVKITVITFITSLDDRTDAFHKDRWPVPVRYVTLSYPNPVRVFATVELLFADIVNVYFIVD